MLAKSIAVALVAALAVACSASPDDGAAADETGASTDEALTQPKSVSLMYEGTCAFLHHCSAWSRKLPAGEVQWGCGGTDCSDDELWMAGPSHGYCNRKAKVCRNGKCVTATIRDISDAKGWEASNAVMDALDLDHTVNVNACSGGGGGRVTVQLL